MDNCSAKHRTTSTVNSRKGYCTYNIILYKEWARFNRSLLIHLHQTLHQWLCHTDCLWSIECKKFIPQKKFQIAHVAALCAWPASLNTSMHVHILAVHETCSISYPKNLLLVLQLHHESSEEKMPRIESHPSVKHLCITLAPKSSSFAVTGLQHVTLLLFLGSCEVLCLACS